MRKKLLYSLLIGSFILFAACNGGPTTIDVDFELEPIFDRSGEAGAAVEIPFTVKANEPDNVELSASSDSPDIIPADSYAFTGSGSDRALTFTPSASAPEGDSARVTIVAEYEGETKSQSFSYTIQENTVDPTDPPTNPGGIFEGNPTVINQTGGQFGSSAAVSRDYTFVGSPEENSVTVFQRQTDSWVEITTLSGASGEQFGHSVATGASTTDGQREIPYVLVGAPGANSRAGVVYEFQLETNAENVSVWVEKQVFKPADISAGDRFGYAIAVDGEKALIGANEDSPVAGKSGQVFFFEHQNDTNNQQRRFWQERSQFRPNDAAANDNFGFSVAINGDYAIIGAPDEGDSGSAYAFKYDGSRLWTQLNKLSGNAGSGARLGRAVALNSSLAMVGAPNASSNNGDSSAGKVFLFKRSGDSWTGDGQINPKDTAGGDLFGWTIAMNNDTALIGAPNKNAVAGAAYTFSTSSKTQTGKLPDSSPPQAGSRFGFSVAISESSAAIGAYNQTTNENSAYIYNQ